MSNHDYIASTLAQFAASEELVSLILFKAGLDSEAPCERRSCDKAMLDDSALIRINTKKSVSEGGMSISWQNVEKELNIFFGSLASSVGAEDNGKSVGLTDRSYLW